MPQEVCTPGAEVRIDARVLLFTVILSICAGVFFGIAPAGHIRTRDLRTVLNETERAGSGKRAKLLRNGLVVSEISLALLLMMGAGLFVRSLSHLSAVKLGFSDDHLLVADLPVPPAATAPTEAHRNMDFYSRILGGKVVMDGENGAPGIVQLENTWVIINVGGGPTDDKPAVYLSLIHISSPLASGRPTTATGRISKRWSIRREPDQTAFSTRISPR